jgi:hypothetical protein
MRHESGEGGRGFCRFLYSRIKFFLRPQLYLQTVLLHLANRSDSKGRLVEECPVTLLYGEWVYGNRVWQQGVDTYRLMLTDYNYNYK